MLRDLAMAFRGLGRAPAFAAVAIVTLALGSGAATAVFAVVNTVLLKPLPYARSGELVYLREQRLPQFPSFSVAPGNFLAWREGSRTFAGMAAMASASFNLTGRGEPERLRADRVTGDYFALLGVSPVAGRFFALDEDRPGAARVAVLSEAIWRGRFAGDPAVVGGTLTLSGEPYTVIGVAPAAMALLAGNAVQLWVPLAMTADEAQLHGSHYMRAVGRLAPGASAGTARADLDRIAAQLEERFPGTNGGWRVLVDPLHGYMTRDVRPALLLLSAAVALVMLVVCANVASLLLARGLARQKELAVRTALGAERRRLVREQLFEGLALAMVAAPGAMFIAWILLRALTTLAPPATFGGAVLTLDAAAIGFVAGLVLVTPMLFALLPALQLSRGDLRQALVSGGRSVGQTLKARTRAALVVGQLALAVVLLVGCGLVLRSFARLVQVDPGFVAEQALVAALQLPASRYPTPEARTDFHRRLLERLRAVPGVVSVGLSQSLPMTNDFVASLEFDGRPVGELADRPTTNFYSVSSDFAAAMGMRLLRGRFIADTDRAGAPRVLVVNETFARRFYPGADPIGQRVLVTQGPSELREIVGVVADSKQYGLAAETTAQVYESYQQQPFSAVSYVLRTAVDPASVTGPLREAVRAIDPEQPISTVQTLTRTLEQSLGSRRFSLALFSTFAALGLALAAVGLYGLIGYTVRQRTNEIGIRVAVGACPRDVARLVVSQALGLAAAGIALGLMAAFAAARLMASLLFDTSTGDPLTFVLVPLVLLAVVVLASVVPARRATRVDAVVALRGE